ncbi:MAG: class I SAM-dependent methyltransferase [bacterium]|nr:class I SAM-dependent methyltransferase [bacterium]
MIQVQYECQGSNGERGVLVVRGGFWTGDECVFEFCETLRGTNGVVRCDWRRPGPHFEVHAGDPSHPDVRQVLDLCGQLLLPFHQAAFADVSDEELRAIYAGAYHADQNYSTNFEFETRYKRRIVDALIDIVRPTKILDAGCSAGEVVRQLRARGVDAHGFDLCADLDAIAYPEVRGYLRQGNVTAIPYGPEDGFDTLLALDVFEHIPESRLPAMIDDFARLGVRRVVALIALCEFQYLGHITLRPLHWWDQVFGSRYRRCQDGEVMGAMARAFDADPGKCFAIYELVEDPVAIPAPSATVPAARHTRVTGSVPSPSC